MRLDPAQVLVMAGQVLDCPVDDLLDSCDLSALERACQAQHGYPAEGFWPAALSALLVALIHEHPFKEGNDAIAVATIGLAASLDDRVLDLDEIITLIDQMHAGEIGPGAVADWLRERSHPNSEEGAMFERFTPRARRALVEAQDEAGHLGHNYIGTEHILLGVARVADGVGAKALAQLGVSTDALRADVIELAPAGSPTTTAGPPFTPKAKVLMEQALRAALDFGHSHIGTEHLLLACFEVKAVAHDVLERQSISEAAARDTVLKLLTGETLRLAGGIEAQARAGLLRAHVLGPNNAVLDENDRMRAEIDRLQALLRRHGIEPDAGTASA
jgi:prophage maintenance system killer protein